MLSAILGWFATKGIGVILGALTGMASDYFRQRQADANAKALGVSTTTAKINQEAADADRRATKAAIDAPDVGGVIDDLDRGKF